MFSELHFILIIKHEYSLISNCVAQIIYNQYLLARMPFFFSKEELESDQPMDTSDIKDFEVVKYAFT